MKFVLHHIGIAVKDIKETEKYYIEVLGYYKENIIIDEEQNLKATFLVLDNISVELLEKLDMKKKAPTDRLIKSMEGGIHHLCYSVIDIEKAVKELVDKKFIKINRKEFIYPNFKTVFLITPDNGLIELLEYI